MASAAVALVLTKTGGELCFWAQLPGKTRVGISASSKTGLQDRLATAGSRFMENRRLWIKCLYFFLTDENL